MLLPLIKRSLYLPSSVYVHEHIYSGAYQTSNRYAIQKHEFIIVLGKHKKLGSKIQVNKEKNRQKGHKEPHGQTITIYPGYLRCLSRSQN